MAMPTPLARWRSWNRQSAAALLWHDSRHTDGVNAYSNSPNQQTIVSCGGAGTNLYQSPEFVLALLVGDAWCQIAHGSRRRGSMHDEGCLEHPGQILCSAPREPRRLPISPTSPAGHVAVVDNLSGGGSTIDIVEQNGVCSGRRAVPRASVQCFFGRPLTGGPAR